MSRCCRLPSSPRSVFARRRFCSRRHKVFPVAVMLAAAAAGFAVATWKTARISHPVLAKPIYSAALTGFVETRDIRERTDRFVLRVVSMESQRGQVKLERVRLSVKKGTAPAVGSFVELKARLLPPMSPSRPGSYDFGRDMYFQRIGASGFVMGSIKAADPPDSGGIALRYSAFMQGLRDAIDARIRNVLDGDKRAIATALLTGRRDAISEPVNDAMFISGLGHVLSISGYHMAVVAGVVFFAIRALLALVPALTVSFPIKKWSAAGALLAAAFYLLLSGAEVATQRSFFMTAVVLIAVMVDRRAITFRTLAVAALIVLAMAPEALVHPSFQMSFAATLGLVALVQTRHARTVCGAGQFHDRAGGAVGRAGVRHAAAGLADRGPRHHALRRVPLPPHHALWRARQSRGDAGGVGAGDAGWPARASGHAVRLRRLLLVADGRRDRLDGRGRAMGGKAARRGRPHAGVRHRPAHRRQFRHHPDGSAAHTAPLERGRGAGACHPLGGHRAAAGYPDLRRWPQCRRARHRRQAASDEERQGRVRGQGVARCGCRCANAGGCLARRWRVLRCRGLRDAGRRRQFRGAEPAAGSDHQTIANAPRSSSRRVRCRRVAALP